MRKKGNFKKIRSSALAILLAVSMMLGLVPEGLGQVYAADNSKVTSVGEEPGLLDKAKNFFSDIGEGITSLFSSEEETDTKAAYDETAVADPSTIHAWNNIISDTTENVGRIWTDKSVSTEERITLPGENQPAIEKGDSDFLVSLSALSSTSNTVTTSSKPLDIVLVLDRSGSMADDLASYKAVYDSEVETGRNGPTYYAKDENGNYVVIERKTGRWERFDHWELNGQEVTPKISAEDNASGHIQFYERSTMSRMVALTDAVKKFIDATAEQNATISKQEMRHRISIVSYSSDSKLDQGLTYVEGTGISELKNKVNNLRANGGTYPDEGLSTAETEFNEKSRKNAQKVIIFFTDGGPGGTNKDPFNGTVANSTIAKAKDLKDNKTLIYSIGVVDGANPDDTKSEINAYMHGVSSNFPNATKYTELGERAENSNYYKAATNADELNNIFKEISDELKQGAGFPTETPEGYDPGKTGYVTFTDQLGEYMQVDTFKELVFAEKVFKPVGEPVIENGVRTYKYEGTATGNEDLYPNGNVDKIIVQVKDGENLKTGDTVTVKIPAGLIPLRYFKVDMNTDGTSAMEIKEAYPIRIFYGVSLKPGVAETLKDGLGTSETDQMLKAYIKTHTKDGKTSFYSNLFTGNETSGSKTLGDTYAEFTPATTNAFYWFKEDTTIYTDKACEIPLTGEPDTSGGTYYYYKKAFYSNNNGVAEEKEEGVRFNGRNFKTLSTKWGYNSKGEVYIKAGAPRLTRIDDITLSKQENTTGTATEVNNPHWDNPEFNPHNIVINLGNNGKLDSELPGGLAIHKEAKIVPNKGIDEESATKNKAFEFKITIPAEAGKTVKAEVKDEQGNVIKEVFDLQFDSKGAATYSIKDEEILYIYDLDKDTEYTVTETKMPKGFTLTSINGDTNAKNATGTIQPAAYAQADFVDTYDIEDTTIPAKEFVGYEKSFNNWNLVESFDIRLRANDTSNPMPQGSSDGVKIVQATEENPSGEFGDITFSGLGTYIYTVTEPNPESPVPGVTYSDASYSVTVTLKDNGDGTAKYSVSMTQNDTDNGQSIEPPTPVEDRIAKFKNTFSATSVWDRPRATKNYIDKGGKPLADGQFSFKLEAVGDTAIPGHEGMIIVKNVGKMVSFGQYEFTADHVGKTYTYRLSEVIPKDAVQNEDGKWTYQGITYDAQVYTVEFTPEVVGDGENATITTNKVYKKGEGESAVVVPESEVVFTNTYDPKDAVLTGNTAVKGTKTLTGRDSKADESFQFKLTSRNNAAIDGLKNDSVIFGGDKDATELLVSVDTLINGNPKEFVFNDISFSLPGIYRFMVVEVAPDDGSGMKYDRHIENITVLVSDQDGNGTLDAAVTYDDTGISFNNVYTAEMQYSDNAAVNVAKILNGRALQKGEFEFTIIGDDKPSERLLSDSDRKFTNDVSAPDGVKALMFNKMSGLKFTQADAGKTYGFTVTESVVNPETGKPLGGVTYDQTIYHLVIQVLDNGDGTMHTVTTVNVKGNGVDATKTYDSADGKDTIELGFINAYRAESVDVDTLNLEEKFQKQLVGRDWKETDSFKFALEAVTPDAPMPKNTDGSDLTEAIVTQPEGTKDGTLVDFGFGTITFDKAGKYVYRVTEEHAGEKIDGITYSNTIGTLYVTISDSGNGQLTATTSVNDGTFVNEYEASLNHNAAGGIVTRKTLTGHALEEGQFTFQVEALKGTDTTAEENAERIGITDGTTEEYKNIVDDDGDGIVEMKIADGDDMVFTSADVGKTFKYKFTEKGADGKFGTGGTKAGYTYDNTAYTVELWVTDDGDGTLTLHTKVNDGEELISDEKNKKPVVLSFVNRYAASGDLNGETALSVEKVLEDRDWIDSDSFSFKLEAGDDATSKAIKNGIVTLPKNAGEVVIDGNDKDHKAKFGNIKFTKPGEYSFIVSEIVPEDQNPNKDGIQSNGITYDASRKKVTVIVSDNNDGSLKAEIAKGSDALTFTNSYAAAPVTLKPEEQFKVTKTLVGRDWTAEDRFTFTLKGVDGAPMPKESESIVVATKNEMTQTFGAITYSAAGEYQYKITETAGTEKDMVYDGHTAIVTVKVSEDKATGVLSVESVTYSDGNDGAQFTNVLSKNTKEVTSEDGNVDGGMVGVGDELTYTINWVNDAVDKNGAPADATVTITDKIPEGTAYVADSAGETAVYDEASKTLTWTIEAKAAQTGSVSFKVVVQESAGGTDIKNQGSVQIGDNDPKQTNEVKTNVPGKSETTNPDEIGEGSILTYQIKFRNVDGEGASANVVDKMTPGLEYQTGTAKVGDNAVEPKVEGDAVSGQTLTWNLEGLAADAEVVITFDVKVTRDALDSVDNSAIVNGNKSNVVTTPYPSDDKKTVEDENGNDQDNGMIGVGDRLTYKINWAADETGKVVVTDKVPTGTKFVNADKKGTYDKETGVITWTFEKVKKGQKGTVSFVVEVTGDAAGEDVTNRANVKVGDNDPKVTNKVDTFVPGKDSAVEGDGELQVGKILTYTISYKNPEDTAATVTITDVIPEGLDYVDGSAGEFAAYDAESRTLTWTLENVPAGEKGTVTFQGRVNESAETVIENKATIQIGDNDPTYDTDTEKNPLAKDGSLAISKTIELTAGQETGIDTKKKFKFTISLTDAAGAALTGEYAYTVENADGKVSDGTITKDNHDIQLKHGETATITGLPAGAGYTVTEEQTAGYTTFVNGKEGNKTNGTITTKETANADFVNAYSAGSGDGDVAAQIQATKKLTGRNMNAGEFSFEVVTRKADESVEDFKEKIVADGTNAEAAEGTDGAVTFAGNDGVKLTYTLESLNEAVEKGYAIEERDEEGHRVWTVSYTAREITEKDGENVLPAGVTAVKASYDFTIQVTDDGKGVLSAEVQYPEGGIVFENTYATGGTEVDTDPAEATAYFNKVLTGRDWSETDEFVFTMIPQNGAPAPEGAAEDGTKTVTVTANAKADESVPFGFGKITFTDKDMADAELVDDKMVKTFVYQVTENDIDETRMPGVTKDGHTATLTITVTDDLQGNLSATASVTAENGRFTNTYKSSIEYSALGGLQMTKVLHGRDMEKEQFTFTVTPQATEGSTTAEEAAEKLGLKNQANEFKNEAAEADVITTMDVLTGKNVTFTQTDAGKTYTYEVAEKAGENPAYSYDTAARIVTISVEDNKDGTLTVTTTVTKDGVVVDEQRVTSGGEGQKKATVAFENTYNDNPAILGGEGSVKINATKTLTNRPMVEGEFTFNVLDKKQNVVTTGTNHVDGTITFNPVSYDTDRLMADVKEGIATVDKTTGAPAYVYVYDYTVTEAPTSDGVTGVTTAFAIKVIVTDNGDGTLEIAVQYPEGKDPLPFENTYGVGTEAKVTVSGLKEYVVESGDNEPDIAGKYTFTLNGVEEGTQNPAPMPERNTVTNDAVGNIDFGTIMYTMENVLGDTAAEYGVEPAKSPVRTKTYVYTVTESGNVPGVFNDPASTKTFTVTVTDNGDGTIGVEKSWNNDMFAFGFVNTYRVSATDYSISTNVTITKELTGRDLREGEFTFELVDSEGNVVATATNAADGTISFGALNYTAPGTYNYVIREQKGTAGGVEYDSAEHTIAVIVTDNGDGALSAKAELKSRVGEEEQDAIVFKNSYTALPATVTLGAGKDYKGAELKDGQFTFELKDENGKVVSVVQNNKDGQVIFGAIEFKEAGTYKYTISEKNDKQKNVTYDKAVYDVIVTITDNGEGNLMAEVEYANGKAPIFTNKYTKPADPEKPEKPREPENQKNPGAVQTGDSAPIIGLVVLMVAAIIAVVVIMFFRRRRR